MKDEAKIPEALNELSYAVIGAAMEVHRILGPGFLEDVYEQALCLELAARNVSFERQKEVGIDYKGTLVGRGRLDILVNNLIIVELKAIERLEPIHTAQMISYLKATHKQLGLLINFNERILKEGIKRIVL
jgi:GxxExxY protein